MDNKKQTASNPKPNVKRTVAYANVTSLVELVFNATQGTSFVVATSEGHESKKEVEIGSRRLLPYSPSNSLIDHRVVLFPSEPVLYGSTQQLAEEIRSYIRKYVDVPDDFLELTVYFVLLTWLYDRFNEVPYLRVTGDFGSGKTRFLLVVGSICNKPIFASGATTVSPIFHILDGFGGTLILDEADFRFSDEKSDIAKILNNGNVRGFPVLRSEQSRNGEFNPRAFKVFGPKIVATRGSYDDQALESRFLTEELGFRPLPKHIPINLPSNYEQEAVALRNKLLMFRIENYFRDIDPVLPSGFVEPRIAQIFGPLLAMIDDQSARATVSNLASRYSRNISIGRTLDVRHHVLECIHWLSRSHKRIAVGVLTKEFIRRYGDVYTDDVTPRWMGNVLRKQLHLSTKIYEGNYVIADTSKEHLQRLCRRYGVGGDVGDNGDVDQAA